MVKPDNWKSTVATLFQTQQNSQSNIQHGTNQSPQKETFAPYVRYEAGTVLSDVQ